ncbi:NADP-dependent oxidoreductase [Actinomycetospora chibensis]|uniref:NADP-dependent oxidoreductase n=1 Tax=Actinomycetospora chibensis TaxID=663606 RepID=A0ABV9RCB4_9PSEU|nr:NADP-dependent oxidoreductase [Actinomycetospora chibensis]MDD7927157.1 NADP-dependent oxidoreductase [Actinomycetospora chibensis]
MLSLVVKAHGGPEVLEIADLPEPELGAHDVRVRVAASAVNPIDLSTRSGRLGAAGLVSSAPRLGLGWDLAGEVDAVGPAVETVAVGEAVIGLRDVLVQPGAQAETVTVDESALAPAPRDWSWEERAALPLCGLTASGALEGARARTGDTVLVTGAAGAVGGFVLELARDRGISAVAAVRAGQEARARALGAQDVIVVPDEPGRLGVEVRRRWRGGVDAVVDTALTGIGAHEALRSGGTFVTLVRPFSPPPIRGTRVVVHEVAADGRALAGLSRIADLGRLTPRVTEVLPLARAADAHRLLEAGGLDGRVVLCP